MALDRVSSLAPGRGQLDLFSFARGTRESGSIGGGLDYGHRLNERISAFARGELGYRWGSRELAVDVLAGLRVTF